MIGRDPKLKVVREDDDFHDPTSTAPNWIETLWFPCWISSENISISIRLWFAINANLQGGAVTAWKGDGDIIFGDKWTEKLSESPDLSYIENSHGVKVTRVEALNIFDVSYKTRDVILSFRFNAVMQPNPVSPHESPGMFEGHFEQAGRVTGSLSLNGKSYEIDCYSLRDRSWGPRQMPEDIRLGNAYGASAGKAFFCYINTDQDGKEKITSGYYISDGEAAVLVDGVRTTSWRDSKPISIEIEAVDAIGRKLTVSGTCRNSMAANAGNGIYAVLNLVEWEQESEVMWGENHDIWSEHLWLNSGGRKLKGAT